MPKRCQAERAAAASMETPVRPAFAFICKMVPSIGRANRQLFNGGLSRRQFTARDFELAFGLGWQRRVDLDAAKFRFSLGQAILRTRQSRTGRIHVSIQTATSPPVGGCLVDERPRLGYRGFGIGHRILGSASRRCSGWGSLLVAHAPSHCGLRLRGAKSRPGFGIDQTNQRLTGKHGVVGPDQHLADHAHDGHGNPDHPRQSVRPGPAPPPARASPRPRQPWRRMPASAHVSPQ